MTATKKFVEGKAFVMDLSGILADNGNLYVLAEVRKREDGRAVEFERLLASGSYEMVNRLAVKYEDVDGIIIPPFNSQDVPPQAAARFFRRYYQTDMECGEEL